MGKSHENKEDHIFERSHSLLQHPEHQHPLRVHEIQGPYKCNGCKLPGFTRCLKCPKNVCDFYLHEACFLAKDFPFKAHEFMEKCQFHYHPSPPRGADKYCDACGLDILGFRYECSTHGKKSHDLHPTCASMTTNDERNWNGLKLKLQDKIKSKCLHCKQRYPAEECVRFTGWKWVSEERYYGFPFSFLGKKICFHVKCIDEYEMYHKYSME